VIALWMIRTSRSCQFPTDSVDRPTIAPNRMPEMIDPKWSMIQCIRTTLWNGIHQFFLAETGLSGIRWGAIFRIGLASIFLYDRILLRLDWDFYFSPTSGVLPPDKEVPSDVVISMFRFMPDPSYDGVWIRTLHIAGLIQGTLLLMGILPRLQAICIYINIVSFQCRNEENMIYDSQDLLMKVMSFYLCFLPLHHYSILDVFMPKNGTQQNSSRTQCTSWPIWPFRIIQCQMCCIYWGAGFGKLSSPTWRWGTAMAYVIRGESFFGGLFRPDVLYNSAGGLQIMTWASLFLECTCWVLVWPITTRRLVVVNMVLFHLGIELAMNLHTFQWLSMLGWLSFLVKINQSGGCGARLTQRMEDPRGAEDKELVDDNNLAVMKRTFRNLLRLVGHIGFPLFIIVYTALNAFPSSDLLRLMEETRVWPFLKKAQVVRDTITSWESFGLWEDLTGMDQLEWNMFKNPARKNTRIVARVAYWESDTVQYWSQPAWTTMSAWERKKIFRQALFWQSIPDGKGWPDEIVFQRAVCQRIVAQLGADKNEIYSVALKIATAVTPQYPRNLLLDESSSVWAWLSAPARQKTFADYYEELLYVHYPSGDRPDGIDKVADFTYGVEGDGFWWDDDFYVYNPILEVYEIAQNLESADNDEGMDDRRRHKSSSKSDDSELRREMLTLLTATSPDNNEL
jgi:hypothetical protein